MANQNNNFKNIYAHEINMLKENLKIAKLKADMAKALYEEAYYMLQYLDIRNKHPELFIIEQQEQIQQNNNNNNNNG